MDFEKIKINLKTPVEYSKKLSVVDMIETDDELLITLDGKECYDIFPGQELVFHRYIGRDGEENVVDLQGRVKVLSEDENHVIHTTIPERRDIPFANIYKGPEEDEIDGEKYSILRLAEWHNVFAQDLDTDNGQEIYVKDEDLNVIGVFSGLAIPYSSSYGRYFSGGTVYEKPDGSKYISGGTYHMVGYNRIFTKDDSITLASEEQTCGQEYDTYKTYYYNFLPIAISTDILLVKGFDSGITADMRYIQTKFNPFYYYKIEYDEDGKEYKHCYFYEDIWWYSIETAVHPENERYINVGPSSVALEQPSAYWTIPSALSSKEDFNTLGGSEEIESYIDSQVQENLIPPIIDMERVKYIPTVKVGDEFMTATSITMDFHFRKREFVDENSVSANTDLTKDNVYKDGWYVDEDHEGSAWWNGMAYSGSTFDNNTFETFLRNKGKTSDLLGYLNFTDNDVFYQKKKVSETFVRLAFYNSTNLVDRRLLYYSTVFLDGTGLFGKFIKQRMFIDENHAVIAYDGVNSGNTEVVFCENNNVSGRVDSEMTVTNEYDHSRSSEGFNLYLFADDVDIKDVDEEGNEKDERTIYLKVDFNHAGNGKTIPMIQNWPKDGDTYQPLTIHNFIESLYIPVKLRCEKGQYIYYFPTAETDSEGNIRLIFFEPKLDNGNY